MASGADCRRLTTVAFFHVVRGFCSEKGDLEWTFLQKPYQCETLARIICSKIQF